MNWSKNAGFADRLSAAAEAKSGQPAGCEKVVGIRFALDSSLEGDGFEPSVPARKSRFLLRKANCGTERGQPKRVVFLCGTNGSNPSPSSRQSVSLPQ